MIPRPVWSEGMHLSQHHFQSQTRYFEQYLGFALGSVRALPYGFTHLGLDSEALVNGEVALRNARGLMPDATPFDFPDQPAPDAIRVETGNLDFEGRATVYLVVPIYRSRSANEKAHASGMARFAVQSVEVNDEVTGDDLQEIPIARSEFRLTLQEGLSDELVSMPVARIRRDATGTLEYDRDFIPPCLRLQASGVLTAKTQRLLEKMTERAGAGVTLESSSASSLVEGWMSHALRGSIPILRNHLILGDAHPETLFAELARLGGALATFSVEASPADLPRYDHMDPTSAFTGLFRQIDRALDLIIPSRWVRELLQADSVDPQVFTALIRDPRALRSRRWFLGVRSGLARHDLEAYFPASIACHTAGIPQLRDRGLPGITIRPVDGVPRGIPVADGSVLFELLPGGEGSRTDQEVKIKEIAWDRIESDAAFGVWVPHSVPQPKIEVFVEIEG